MFTMILKMSAIAVLYILVTLLLWKIYQNKKITIGAKILIGVVYGIASVLSTHFGVDYQHMVLNIRDVGPLTAGLFFDPVSAVIAGLIGGIERFIAGTFWGIGSYTTYACSISTILAGMLGAFIHVFVLKKKRPLTSAAIFIGAVMEVFHMYAVFITHRDDMSMASYVVQICAVPMIAFSAITLGVMAFLIRLLEGEKPVVFRKQERSKISIAQFFQRILLVATLIILAINFCSTYSLQTAYARQEAAMILEKAATAVRGNYKQVSAMKDAINQDDEEWALAAANLITQEVDREAGVHDVDANFLEQMRQVFELDSVIVVNENGEPELIAGTPEVYLEELQDVLEGKKENDIVVLKDSLAVVGVHSNSGGMVQAVVAIDSYADTFAYNGVQDVFSNFQVGNEGTFDIVSSSGNIVSGDHAQMAVTPSGLQTIADHPEKTAFEMTYFGVPSLCWKEDMRGGLSLIVTLPKTEVYESRNAHAYETALADIMLFAAIYAVTYILVQYFIIKNLDKVNTSLAAITDGNLEEVVDVRTSSEFSSLSDDINETVTALKGYISEAEHKMEQELEYARVIQESALPRNFKVPRDDFSVFALMDPAREVGGDFYDFFIVRADVLGLVIADVSGKGIPASLFMMRSKTIIQGLAKSLKSPSEILFEANNALCEGNDAESFVTAWIGIIDLNTGIMTCANGGHEYPILMRADGDYELVKDKHGLVLGAMENAKYTEYELQFNPGDKLFVYTDGVPEAINEEIEQYGTDRLCQALNKVKEATVEETIHAIKQDVTRFVRSAEQFDDITMLSFSFNHFGTEEK